MVPRNSSVLSIMYVICLTYVMVAILPLTPKHNVARYGLLLAAAADTVT